MGCGGGGSDAISGGGKVAGHTVTVYSLVTDPGGRNRDFVDGEKLALSDAGGRAARWRVNFNSFDLGTEESDEAEAVRRAVNDPGIIAAVVDATPVTVPLFNAAGVLQVAPGGDFGLATDPNAQPLGRQTVFQPRGDAARVDFDADFREAFGRAPGDGAADGYRVDGRCASRDRRRRRCRK